MFRRQKKQQVTTVRVSGIEVEITQKRIKNLYLKVSPVTGKVRVSAPIHARWSSIESFITSKSGWIEKQLTKKVQVDSYLEPEYKTGETHYVQGVSYTLTVIETSEKSRVIPTPDRKLELWVKPGSTTEKRRKVLNEWYRSILKREIPKLIQEWEPVMGVRVNEFGVKLMKTHWGTCNTRDKRIWLSLELAKKPCECLEYVVVHEMVHLLERLHNARFHAYMDQFLPDWRERKKELNGRVC